MALLKLTLIQSPLVWESPAANREYFENKLSQIKTTDMVLLPEMFTTGFTMRPQAIAETMEGETLQWMQALAKKHETALGGSVVIHEGEFFYNRFVLVSPDGSIQYYDKRHTFTLAGEHQVYKAGENDGIVAYKGWKICLRICYDLRFPVWSRNTVDYDLLIYVANWPRPRIQSWDALLRARAIENMAYCVGVNCVGSDPNRHHYPGHSAVYDLYGNLVSSAISESEAVLTATLDKNEMCNQREHLPFLKDRDRFQFL